MTRTSRSAGFAVLAFTLTAGLISLAIAAPAAAGIVDPEVREVRVSTSGLDLASSAGQARLETRISTAIDRLCFEPGDRLIGRDELDCRAHARASVAPQVALLTDRAERLASASGSHSRGETIVAFTARRD